MSNTDTLPHVPAQMVREWAQSKGITEGYGTRGRISYDLLKRFLKARPAVARKAQAGTLVPANAKPEPLIRAADVRAWAAEAGVETGARGRVKPEVIVDYLVDNPRTAREIAASVGMDVPARGRLSRAVIEEIASRHRN